MTTEYEYGLFAYDAYFASDENRVSLPSAWAPDASLSTQSLDGFAASVYHNGTSEVVISFRGTDFDHFAGKVADFASGNVPAALGTYSGQVWEAIRVVADTIAAYPSAQLSFTGHSLGGGLASLMAVYFNKPAMVFDPAPFAPSATNVAVVAAYFAEYTVYQTLHLRLPSAEFSAYAASATLLYPLRDDNVSGFYVQDEVLTNFRTPLNTVN